MEGLQASGESCHGTVSEVNSQFPDSMVKTASPISMQRDFRQVRDHP